MNANFEKAILNVDVPKRAEASGQQIKLGIGTEEGGINQPCLLEEQRTRTGGFLPPALFLAFESPVRLPPT